MIVAMLRGIFWAKFREFGMISVAPRNIKPLVVPPTLTVEARETVWAVLVGIRAFRLRRPFQTDGFIEFFGLGSRFNLGA